MVEPQRDEIEQADKVIETDQLGTFPRILLWLVVTIVEVILFGCTIMLIEQTIMSSVNVHLKLLISMGSFTIWVGTRLLSILMGLSNLLNQND
jgi:hypothetical protein